LHALLRNQAGAEVGEQLTDLATGIYGGAYEADQGRRMAALSQLGGLGQTDVQNRLAAAGAAPRFDQARFADAERLYRLGQMEQQAPYQIAQQYGNFLGSLPTTSGGRTITEPGVPLGSEIFSGALGLGQLGLAGYGISQGLPIMLSDRRTKENAEPIGISFGNKTIYRFNYRHDPSKTPQIGFMADEVLADQPEAVLMWPNGLLGIDFSKVT
jgi:hypothetical protein